MHLAEFFERLRPMARPTHDWIVLGDGSICIRDHINADPINMVAIQINPYFTDSIWMADDDGELARFYLSMSRSDFARLENAVSGQCADLNWIRRQVLHVLNMKEDWDRPTRNRRK